MHHCIMLLKMLHCTQKAPLYNNAPQNAPLHDKGPQNAPLYDKAPKIFSLLVKTGNSQVGVLCRVIKAF